MSSLQEALLEKKGQLSGLTVRPMVSDEDVSRVNETRPKMNSHFSIIDLDSCASMRKFKEMAERILLDDASLITEVVQKAHRFKNDSKPENKKFIWFFYELRDQLRKLPLAKHAELFKRAFRKSGATFELPDARLKK